MIHWKETKLAEGRPFITSEKGNSMAPKLRSGQEHELSPCDWEECFIDDIVFCKVNGRYYTHLVKGTDSAKGLLIGNNRGSINGWTKKVYGKVTKIF